MKSIKRFNCQIMLLLCLLLACLCLAALKPSHAQTGQPRVENFPGVPAGYTIIDGDIQMPISVVNTIRQQVRQSPSAPQATLDIKLWPNGIVPFRFENNCQKTSNCNSALPSGCVSAANQQLGIQAMAVLSAVANLTFMRCANDNCGNRDHIGFRDSTNDTTEGNNTACVSASANDSPVGRQGGEQTINIVDWGTRFVIVHELMHSLGFYHEHTRADRGNFVEVDNYCSNVQGGCLGDTFKANFPTSNDGVPYGPYDFDSVMHYGQCSFSRSSACPNSPVFPGAVIEGGITIKVKPPFDMQLSPKGTPWPQAIGQRDHISFLDQLSVSFLYPQPNWRFADPGYGGQRGAPDGTFLRPYTSLDMAVAATPKDGLLWLQPGIYLVFLPISKQITIRAPLGGATIRPLSGVAGATLASLSAASYNGELSSESIVAAFGQNLAFGTAVATSLPLPTTLSGTRVSVKDSEGTERNAPLFFVSPAQINYQIPMGTSAGVASIGVYQGGTVVASGLIPITATSPGIFTANASGQGAPAGFALRVRADGSQSSEPLARYDTAQQRFIPAPIDLGPEGEQVFLILFGSGFRSPSSPDAVRVTIGGEDAEVLYAGPAPGFVGLDQTNVHLPRALAGKGEVSILLTADNRSANAVTVSVR